MVSQRWFISVVARWPLARSDIAGDWLREINQTMRGWLAGWALLSTPHYPPSG